MMVRSVVMMTALALCAGSTSAQTPEDAAKAIAALAGYDRSQSRAPLVAVEELIRDSGGNAELRRALRGARRRRPKPRAPDAPQRRAAIP